MMRHLLFLICLYLCSFVALADSFSVMVKPEKGLSGTFSLNIHDDLRVTTLVYKSAQDIVENEVKLTPDDSKELIEAITLTLDEYLQSKNLANAEQSPFTLSIFHTRVGVTRSISTKKIIDKASKLVDRIVAINPAIKIDNLK